MSQYERILGLDLSLTSTGMVLVDTTLEVWDEGAIQVRQLKPRYKGMDRLKYQRDIIVRVAEQVDVVGIEGLALGSNGNGAKENAGLQYIVRLALWEIQKPVVIVPVQSRMRYATGKGGGPQADKRACYDGARALFPTVELPEPHKTGSGPYDLADALLVAAVTGRVVGSPFGPIPESKAHYDPVNTMGVERDPTWPI